ncbi:MAG TPA: response regulator [Bryobacterales bacterium]|jgi:two-component system response regulator|nr:response regulator [Bryobacterales bacterium]
MDDGEPLEVLLVEDNLDDVALTLRALRKHNLINEVHVVNDGAAALEHIFGRGDGRDLHRPRVIFLDLKLPKVSGLEVLSKLKADERTRTIPVVVLTSSHEDQDVTECYRLGVNSYIVKPVEFDDFIRSVSELGFYWMLLNKPAV